MVLILLILSAGACCTFAFLTSTSKAGGLRSPLAGAYESSAELRAGRDAAAAGPASGMCAVTISREYGSGGGEVAARLAKRLGWQLIDHEIVARVAHALGVSREAAEAHDECVDEPFSEFLAGLQAMQGAALAPLPVEVPSDSPAYARARRLVVREAVAGGKVVIVGRGAQVLLAGRRDVLHARIVAPLEARIAYVMRREALSAAAALERIQSKDRERARFLMAEHGCDPADAHLYDIELNTAVLDLDSVVDLLVHALERKGARLATPGAELGPGAGLEPYPGPPAPTQLSEASVADG
jgi:cytidylate kinase